MNSFPVDWLEVCVAMPLLGATAAVCFRDRETQRRVSLLFCGLALVAGMVAWLSLDHQKGAPVEPAWSVLRSLTDNSSLSIDRLSAPLLPLAALLYLLTTLVTLHTKARRFSFPRNMLAEGFVLATLATRDPLWISVLLAAAVVPAWLELRSRGRPTLLFSLHMGLFIALLAAGCFLPRQGALVQEHPWLPSAAFTAAALIRCGIFPFHLWMTDLFENATFGRAMLFVTPMTGAYAAARLAAPDAPDWLTQIMAALALFTAVYAGGMALVQKEARRFFCYIFLGHSAIVLVGLQSGSPVALTGALCLWLSTGLALTGFGLTIRALEARHGRMSLSRHHGAYAHTPLLGVCFLVTGLASVGFPGTFGFIGSEILVDAALETSPYIGIALAAATAFSGIAILRAYFLLFTGVRAVSSVPLGILPSERWAVLTLVALMIGGAAHPQPGVSSRRDAAEEMLATRARALSPNIAAAGEGSRPELSAGPSSATSSVARLPAHSLSEKGSP